MDDRLRRASKLLKAFAKLAKERHVDISKVKQFDPDIPYSKPPAWGTESSRNEKVGPISTTKACRNSCPESCPYSTSKKGGCYADGGKVGMWWDRTDNNLTDPSEIAKWEVEAINRLSGQNPLRLHETGDCKTIEAAQIVSEACDRYHKRWGAEIFSYTHAWKDVPRDAWSDVVSIFGSCRLNQVDEVRAQGYAPAIVVRNHHGTGPYVLDGEIIVPCVKDLDDDVVCAFCLMCTKADFFYKHGLTLAFRGTNMVIKAEGE